MGPKGEPGTAGNRGPTGRPGKRGKQVRLLWSRLSPQRKYDTQSLTASCWFGCAAGGERRSRKWWSHGPCRPAGTGGTSRPSRFTCHRWEPAAQEGSRCSFPAAPLPAASAARSRSPSRQSNRQREKDAQRFNLAAEEPDPDADGT